MSAFILLAGAISDRFGRLRVLRIALIAFAASSLLCALAPTAGVLVGMRLLQGTAGALLVPGSLGLILAQFNGASQAKAIGSWTGWTSVSFLVGPILGGLLVDQFGWRSVFLIGLLPAAGSMLLLGRTPDGRLKDDTTKPDVPAALLTAVGLGSVTLGLIELGSGGAAFLPRGFAALFLTIGSALLGMFVLRNARARYPLVPPALFASRNFSAGNATTLLVYGALGLGTLVPTLYLQQVLGLSATAASLLGLPSTILLILLSGRFGVLAGKYGPRGLMAAGPLISAAGAAVWAFVWLVPSDAPRTVAVGIGMLCFGLGMAVTVAPLTAAVLSGVPTEKSSIGSAVNNAVARVASLVTTATVGLLLGGAISTPGFIRVATAAAILMTAGSIVSFLGIRRVAPPARALRNAKP